MDTSIQLPSGDGGDQTIELQMGAVYNALSRIEEIAIVNSHKAPELCACFARAYATLTEHLARISSEVVKAKNALQLRVAVVTIDEAPRILREKGLISARSPGGSEDLRKAVLEKDVEYQQRRNRLQELEAYHELISGKQESAEQAYLAVRKLMGADIGYQGRNMRLGSSIPGVNDEYVRAEEERVSSPAHQAAVNKVESSERSLRSQFGKPRD